MWILCRGALALALCVLGAASLPERAPRPPRPALPLHHAAPGPPAPRRRPRAAEHWLALIAEIARIGAISEQARADKSSSAEATLSRVLLKSLATFGAEGAPQVLVIPVPVPAPQYRTSSQTSSAALNLESLLASYNTSPINKNDGSDYSVNTQLTPSILASSKVSSTNNVQLNQETQFHSSESISKSTDQLMISVSQEQDPESQQDTFPISSFTQELSPQNAPVNDTSDLPTRFMLEEHRAQDAIFFPPVEDTQQLLRQFHEQVASDPSLPPVVLEPANDGAVDEKDPAQDAPRASSSSSRKDGASKQPTEQCVSTCQQASAASAEPPPRPRFERTMMLEAVLTVPRAGYSEPYTLWWDAASGASRIDHHHGAASSYRVVRADGRMQAVHVRVDRTGEADARRCVLRAPRRVALAERAPPVLPDLRNFTFAGYVEASAAAARVERWVRAVASAGGARGEALTYRHELLVARAPDGHTSTPLRYAVAVDSALLGAGADAYVHRFLRVRARPYDAATFDLDLGDACDLIEKTDRIERVEPFREFSLPHRDPVYDEVFERYKRQYNRQYTDDLEEAVRKNVLIQTSRFVSSGNRQGASFEQKANFLSDRLKVELEPIYGAQASPAGEGIAFPYSRAELRRLESRLPLKFDWRERGGVTPVRNQMLCPSCWAFSVVGAVEGALFTKTGRLVSLSEQSLVDCGNRSGANGCGRTWPDAAYDYVRDYGLPALDEYGPYVAKAQQCAAERAPPVTRIAGHVRVPPLDVLALKVAIRRHGPTVVLVDGREQSLQTSPNLYYSDAKCKKEDSNHAMLAVGWTQHRGAPYFILKNSWSAGWARGGYVYVRGDTNTCGVLRRPSFPVLRRADVQRVPADAPAH